MSSKAQYFLNKTLGEDFFQTLEKFELWKPATKTVVDHEEIKTALQIVPRVIMSLLIKELAPMEIEETKEFTIPVEGSPVIKATKHERDVYTGDIREGSKVIVDFKYRTIPGIGLVVMSAFELYDISRLSDNEEPESDISLKVQKLIDERMALHELVNRVVDKKLMAREAVQAILLSKLQPKVESVKNPDEKEDAELGEKVEHLVEEHEEENKEAELKEKGSPLKKFLEKRKTKLKKTEYSINMAKGESFSCPDCGQEVFSSKKVYTGCVCLGSDMQRKIFIKKSENGIKVKFSNGWDSENIQMLLEMLRSQNG